MLHVTLRCSTCTESEPYQKDVFKDLRGTVHLAQDDNHLVVDELLELSQVARHVHFQLGSDLRVTVKTRRNVSKKTRKLKAPEGLNGKCSTSLEVTFSRSFCIMISLRRVLICRSVSSLSVGLQKNGGNKPPSLLPLRANAAEVLNGDTYASEKSRGESARCDCTSCMAFHSLMRTWSEETRL